LGLGRVSLDDKYALSRGRIFLTGIQALVRLSLVQARRDQRAGLDTRGFISGYRGSPLGGLDLQLGQAHAALEKAGVEFQPGLNEELALTAVWGSQMLSASPGFRHQGVFGLWYGKAPGLDRASDALKHANASGSMPLGGVVVVAGDDHECKSSTLPSQSELAFMDAGVPVLNPAGVQEVLDYGLYGFALSRFAGCFTGLIALADTMDSSATVDAGDERVHITLPDFDTSGLHFEVGVSGPDLEQRVFGPRLDAARAFVRANRLDRVIRDAPEARLGIITTGKSTLDVLQALDDLGIDPAATGIRIYKVAMPWPLEPEGVREFANGLDEILVVEEKRDLLESQLKNHLYGMPRAPRIVGKRDEAGRTLLAATGSLTPGAIARALVTRMPAAAQEGHVQERLAQLERGETSLLELQGAQARTPFFCSGCPHNRSTQVPEGSRGLAGIGCHYMVRWMGRDSDTFSQMGGEGVQWLGQAPFSDEPHVFANLGDGTYFHSGILAIRASVSAGAHVTYKLLFNDAVAMTGGQSLDGTLSVPRLTRQLAAEGIERIAVVSDEPDRYGAHANFAPGTTLHARKSLDAVSRELRETPGCTVLVYDQTCAAELRRRRKRGLAPDPQRRVFINEAVCEGCGDCSTQSNCISIEPVETELGRKRRVNQTTCNKDFSCAEGLCPSFVSVMGGDLQRQGVERDALIDALTVLSPPTPSELEEPWNLVITGIGGTGVVTLGALIGMAAHLEGKGSTVLDMTGLAQKGGAVVSHIRIGSTPDAIHTTRVPAGKANGLIACDLIVAAGTQTLPKLDAAQTHSVVNTHLVPTAEFVMDNAVTYDTPRFLERIHDHSRELDCVDATAMTTKLLGDAVTANVFLLGYAFQRGLVPVGIDAIEHAIELNGVAVETNLQAFRWGRVAADSPDALPGQREAANLPVEQPPIDPIEHRADLLVRYQGESLAKRYRALLERVEKVEAKTTSGTRLRDAVARGYHKVLAYKDEYEVARLHSDAAFHDWLGEQVDGDYRVEVQLAPPLFARIDPETGRPRKHSYGPWMFRAMKWLAKFKFLRGTPLDPFGHTAERRMERALIARYEDTLERVLAGLSPDNHSLAVEIADLPTSIRGFGAVKLEAAERCEVRERELLDRFLKNEHSPHEVDLDDELEDMAHADR
jgi:indolepyruvate ferredoxin oxidoreductase